MNIVKAYNPKIFLFEDNGSVTEFKTLKDAAKFFDWQKFRHLGHAFRPEIEVESVRWGYNRWHREPAIHYVLKNEFGDTIEPKDVKAAQRPYIKPNNLPESRSGTSGRWDYCRNLKILRIKRWKDAWNTEEHAPKVRKKRYRDLPQWGDDRLKDSLRNWKSYRKQQWKE